MEPGSSWTWPRRRGTGHQLLVAGTGDHRIDGTTGKVADAIEITESNPRNCTKFGELSAVGPRQLRPAIPYSRCACPGTPHLAPQVGWLALPTHRESQLRRST
jgi:hypothetical protein